jgi:hypothetical protein
LAASRKNERSANPTTGATTTSAFHGLNVDRVANELRIPSPGIPSSTRPASAGLFFDCGCQPIVGYRNPMPDQSEDFGERPRGA